MSLLEESSLGGLNDETYATLAENAPDVKEPDLDDPNPVMAILPEAPPEPDAVDAAVAAMPNYDAKIVSMTDKVAKVYDVQKLATQLLATESISQSDAEEIVGVLPGLQDEVATVKEYSQVPTRTNLTATQNYVQSKEAELVNELDAELKDFLKGEFTALISLRMADAVAPIAQSLTKLMELSREDLVAVGASKNFFGVKASGNDRTVDLRELPLRDMAVLSNYAALPSFIPHYIIVMGLNEISSSHIFGAYHQLCCPEVQSPDWTYHRLLVFFSTGGHRELLEEEAVAIDTACLNAMERVLSTGWRNDGLTVLSVESSRRMRFMQILQQYRLLCFYAERFLAEMRKNL